MGYVVVIAPRSGPFWWVSHTGAPWVLTYGVLLYFRIPNVGNAVVVFLVFIPQKISLWMTICDMRVSQWTDKFPHLTVEVVYSSHISNNISIDVFLNEGTLLVAIMPSRYYPNLSFDTLRPRQNGRRFADDTFKPIFLNENVKISIKISLKFVLKVQLTIIQHWFR